MGLFFPSRVSVRQLSSVRLLCPRTESKQNSILTATEEMISLPFRSDKSLETCKALKTFYSVVEMLFFFYEFGLLRVADTDLHGISDGLVRVSSEICREGDENRSSFFFFFFPGVLGIF